MTSSRSAIGSNPATRTVPAVGRSIPASTRSKVVFPDPFGPTSPTISPAPTTSSTPASARRPPKRRSSAFTSTRISVTRSA